MAHLKKLSWLALLLPVLVLGGAVAGIMLHRRRHRGKSGACCDLPRGTTSTAPEKEPALRP